MKNNKLKYLLSLLFTLVAFPMFAQTVNGKVEMDNLMYANGKIYVVVAVVVVIFIGFMIYLITLDRKTRRLEKAIDEMESEQLKK